MEISEKVAYLKGLAEGLALDTDTKEGKLIAAIIDVLDDMAEKFVDLEDELCDVEDGLDAVSDDLEDVEDVVFGEDDEDDEDECCGCCCDEEDEDEEPVFYEVTCPACENTITIDEDVLSLGAIECPNCGETLEFEGVEPLEDEEDEDEEN